MTRISTLAAALFTFVAACTLAFPANAQDASALAGFYGGANIGISWGDASARTDVTSGSGPIVIPPQDIAAITAATHVGENDDNGFTGGVQSGYNWISGAMMLGVETDFAFMHVNESSTATAPSPSSVNPAIDYRLNQSVETSWIWTVRPRIGLVAESLMLFASAGFAVTDVKYDVELVDTRTPANAARGSFDEIKAGWTGSLGATYVITKEWSVTGEWLYADFGAIDGTASAGSGFVALKAKSDVRASLLRLGVNTRF